MEYPRPSNGSKRGVHWTASDYPAHANFQWHLDWMVKCGIGWLKYVSDGNASRGQGDSGLQVGVECLKRGIVPINRFYLPADHNWTDANEYAVAACVAVGVLHIEPMNEPDLLQVEWGNPPSKDEWLKRSFTTWIHQAKSITSLGGIPLSPALASGAFQDRGPDAGQVTVNPFVWVREAGITDFVCAIHNYTGNHPIDYPYDDVNQNGKALTQAEYDKYGPEAWDYRSIADINAQRERDKNPGDTIDDDDSCFLAVMKFRQLLDEAGFNHVPIMTTEGGPVHTDLWDGRYPRVVPNLFIEMLEQELAWMADKDWYHCICPWLWANNAAGGTGGWADCQWFHPGHPWVDSDGFMPVVKWLIARPISEDGNTNTPTEPEEPEDPGEEEPVEPELVNGAENYGVSVEPAVVPAGTMYWKAISVQHLTPAENQGNHNVYVNAFDANGEPCREARVVMFWDDGNAVIQLEKEWPSELEMAMGNGVLTRDAVSVRMGGIIPSDAVHGLCTDHGDEPGPHGENWNSNGHHSFLVEFQLCTRVGETEPEEPAEPEVPVEVTLDDIREAAWNELYPTGGVRYNPTAALLLYARTHDLGASVTNEFDIGRYRVQGFATRIAYVVIGDWQNIRPLAW